MSEFLFVHMLDKLPVGANVGRRVPLHMTILHWFEVECEQVEVAEKTKQVLKNFEPVTVQATTEDLLGRDYDIPVMKVTREPRLVQVHVALLGAMKELGAVLDEQWTGEENWNPHVTHKKDSLLQLGDSITVKDIDLLTRASRQADRVILDRFNLGN